MKKNLVVQILIAFVVGLAVGFLLWAIKGTNENVLGWYVTIVKPFGDVLVAMLKMIVVPVIFLSLIAGAASLPLKEFGKVGVTVLIWYLVTSLFAALVGTGLALSINPAGGGTASQWANFIGESVQQAYSPTNRGFADIILSMFENPFQALANGNFLGIIVFAIAFGIGLKVVQARNEKMKKGATVILDFVNTANETVFTMVDWILMYSPIGVFALTSVNFATYGSLLVGPYIKLTLGVVIGILCMIFVVYPIMLFIATKKNPFKVMVSIREPMLTAFVTRSSSATLPITLKTAQEKLGINDALASFSLPLGSTINMDGVCVHLPMFAILAANIFGVQLGFGDLAVLVLTTVLASIGAGGVPGGSLMLLFIILQNMNLNEMQISTIVGIAMGINPILDMFETMNNVTGDLVCTYAVGKMHDMVDEEKV